MSKFVLISLFASALVVGVFAGGDQFAICDELKDEGFSCETNPPQSLFYYDGLSGFCEPLNYKGCGGNGNQFSSLDICDTFCIIQGEARPN